MLCESVRETQDFRSVCESGELYDFLSLDAGIERAKAKKEFFRDVLFGKPHINGRVTVSFGRRWPTLLDSIRGAKRKHGYKVVAQALQRLESVVMLDGVCFRLLREFPSVPFLTIHDSTLLTANAGVVGQVRDIMTEEFLVWRARPTIREKSASDKGGEE